MAKRLNLIGQRYGLLTVIEELAQKGTKRRFFCRCDCGNTVTALMDSLRSGNTKSCGCLRKINVSEANTINLIGQRFGRLTVVARSTEPTTEISVRWVCRCDCGAETVVTSSNLRSGQMVSCGCLRRERARDLGKRRKGWRKNDG